jgi:hypothetical protein
VGEKRIKAGKPDANRGALQIECDRGDQNESAAPRGSKASRLFDRDSQAERTLRLEATPSPVLKCARDQSPRWPPEIGEGVKPLRPPTPQKHVPMQMWTSATKPKRRLWLVQEPL